jgi:hypothetical protein
VWDLWKNREHTVERRRIQQRNIDQQGTDERGAFGDERHAGFQRPC